MKIILTDEQYEQLMSDANERHGVKTWWLSVSHEPSELELYVEGRIEGGKTVIEYVDANRGEHRFYGDEDIRDRFLKFGKRKELNDKNNECPNCCTPMIYRFNYCPNCGQVLEWEKEVEE